MYRLRISSVQTIITKHCTRLIFILSIFQEDFRIFCVKTVKGDVLKDTIFPWKEFDPQDDVSMLEEYYFNSLSHSEKISAIVNSIGLKLKRGKVNIPNNTDKKKNSLKEIKWSIGNKRFDKRLKLLSVELLSKYDVQNVSDNQNI